MPPKILVIVGPTASGKTRLAVELAHEWNGEVVSADSMQVYRRMDIGTAKPTAEEMDGIPHHMIDVADPGEDFSAARYVEMASACVDGILARGRLPIVAGGTGLYIDSLLSGRTFAAFSPDSPLRGELEAELARRGGAAMLEELAQALELGFAHRDVPLVGQRVQRGKTGVVAGAIVLCFGVAQPCNEPDIVFIHDMIIPFPDNSVIQHLSITYARTKRYTL